MGVEAAEEVESAALLRTLLDGVTGGAALARVEAHRHAIHRQLARRLHVVRVLGQLAHVLMAVLLEHHHGRLADGVLEDAIVVER